MTIVNYIKNVKLLYSVMNLINYLDPDLLSQYKKSFLAIMN